MRGEPLAQVLGVARQTRRALLPLDVASARGACRLRVGRVIGAMAFKHGGLGGLQLGGPALKVGARPAPLLRRVARPLHPVDGEHLAPNQARPVAYREYGREDRRDVGAERAHEVRHRRKERPRIAAEGAERLRADTTGLLSSGLLNDMVCVRSVVIRKANVAAGAGGMLRRCILLIHAGQRVATPERQELDSSGAHLFEEWGWDDR